MRNNFPSRRIVRGLGLLTAAVWLAAMPQVGADDVPGTIAANYPGLTPARLERLKERDPHQTLALQFSRTGKLDEAAAEAEEMMAIEREVLGDRHPDVAGSLDLLAQIHLRRRDFVKARAAARQGLEVAPEAWGSAGWRIVDARLLLERIERISTLNDGQIRELQETDRLQAKADQLRRQRRLDVTVGLIRRYSVAYRKLLGDRDAHYVTSLATLAVVLEEQGNVVAARPIHDEALAAAERTWGNRHPSYATCLDNLGSVHWSS